MARTRRRRACALFATLLPVVHSYACDNASTVFLNPETNSAIAYDAQCLYGRPFDVRKETALEKYLNLSNLELVRVDSYPDVLQMNLAVNQLTAFKPVQEDTLMQELDLHQNRITTLDALRLPPSLTKLDLSNNAIAYLSATFSWPSAPGLRWLALDTNDIVPIAAKAFSSLTSLQYLSLSDVELVDIGYLSLPPSLQVLNLSRNLLTTETINFTTRPIALQTLDLSQNKLTKFPDLSYLGDLRDLNLAANAITTIAGVRLPPRLKTLNLDGNAITTFEVTASDFAILMQLEKLNLATDALAATCANAQAKPKILLGGTTVCVVSDESPAFDGNGKVAPPATDKNESSALDAGSTGAPSSGGMSVKAMLLVGLGCFGMGLIVAVFVVLLRREKRAMKPPVHLATFAPEFSGSDHTMHSRNHPLDRSYGMDGDPSWVFESPRKGGTSNHRGPVGAHNVVAILEDDRRRRGRGRSKVEDLLVYEIPLDEIVIQDAVVGKPHAAAGEAMYHAEYQGYQVVMHALLRRGRMPRGKRRAEREFVEQARLASSLEHLCIVQFIGITLGTHSQSQKATHKWKMGVVFEHMHLGSLAALFTLERTRRDGKQFIQRSLTSGGFSWYPAPATSTSADDGTALNLCKLSIALDVAMALVYLHSMGYVHGDLHAGTVLVNEHGEAKLSAMDMSLAMNVPPHAMARVDMRASAIKAKMKVKTLFANTSISQSPAMESSLLTGTLPLSSMTASMLTSVTSRARRRGMHGDVYAFGLLLWELDTMMSMDAMQQLTAAATESGEEHQLLRFSPECPSEVQFLARRCWHPDLAQRASALDLQEDLVRLLEGRLTTLSERSAAHRWSRRTRSSAALSSSFHSNHSGKSSYSDFGASTIVIAETEV